MKTNKYLIASAIISSALLILPALASADTIGPITFEPSAPTYTVGNINGQNGWSMTGAYDVAVSDNSTISGAPASFATQSLRISNAVTSGSFGDQTFAPPLTNAAGESNADLGGFPSGPLQAHFESQFDIYAIPDSIGDVMSVSPDRGDGARMSYLRFDSEADGIHVYFDDVTDPTHSNNEDTFNESQIALLSSGVPHTVKFSMDFYDGPDNDVVNIYIDDHLMATGTSWEDYYLYDSESNPGFSNDHSRAVRTMLFRAGGAAVPANLDKGFLIDNLTLASGPIPASSPSECTPINLVSDTSTFTGGWTNGTNVKGGVAVTNDASGLNPLNYTDTGNFVTSMLANLSPTGFTLVPGPWTDPSSGSFAGSGAAWISDIAASPGDSGGEGAGTEDQWRLFQKDFNVPAGATVSPITIYYTADNAVSVYFNGVWIGDTNPDLDTYAATPGSLPSVFGNTYSATFTPVAGQTNTLSFVVRNSSYPGSVNPTGLLYSAQGQYCFAPPPPQDGAVHIFKFVDGVQATTASVGSVSFPMFTATYNAPFTLGPGGWNPATPDVDYEASTNVIPANSTYTANEDTTTSLVGPGPECDGVHPYVLVGYSTGSTLQDAENASQSSTPPTVTINGNQYIIVWNKSCTVTPPATLKVHIEKYLDGKPATAESASNYIFPMTATWQTANLNGGAQTSGPYTLGTGWGGATGYFADTAPMQAPADYVTSEITSDIDPSSQVVPSIESCSPGKYYFDGYSTSPMSFDDAATAATTTTPIQFSQITTDQYVIVWNDFCPTTATLTITKETNGGNGSGTYNFTSDIPNHPSFSITTTNHSGSVTFDDVAPGIYNVTEVNLPKGWTETDNSCTALPVAAGDNINCIITNTSNKLLGSIRGTKYEDRDGDGTLKDGDHHKLSGVTIFLDANNNGQLDNGETSLTTNKQGFYDFTGLVAGTYHVCEVVPSGWTQTYPKTGGGCYTVTLSAGQNAKKKDFGNFKPGTISGMKYNDANGNGRKDNGETGLEGWTIVLHGPHGQTQTTTTGSDGSFSFTGLAAGTYTLTEVSQTGWTQTQHPGSIKVQSGTNAKNENFGNTQHPKKGKGSDGDNDWDDNGHGNNGFGNFGNNGYGGNDH
ncbi:MAG TPA: SdrD B-like domain-containing protein [Candidatus Paceibacterota bacterium]|nr:SdrD B-like domain-containing protein [Candidatus Paceibacterota bacterium]